MIQTDSGNYDERITSCNIKWDNWGLITGKSTHHVITDILSKEIQVRFYNGFGLKGGSIWPLNEEQKNTLFNLLEECKRECDKDDYSVPMCDGSHWTLKLYSNEKCIRTIEGNAMPPKGEEISAFLENIIGPENCYFWS